MKIVAVLRGILPQIILCMLAVTLPGCTQVNVYGQGGVSTKDEFGIVHVTIRPAGNPSYVETNMFGLVLAENSVTAGWSRQSVAVFPDPKRCAVLIVPASAHDVAAVEEVLKLAGENLSKLCITGA